MVEKLNKKNVHRFFREVINEWDDEEVSQCRAGMRLLWIAFANRFGLDSTDL